MGLQAVQDDNLPAKQREIMDGARRVFRAEGFDGASMDKIARAAGVSKGTLYVYFRNKEDLFRELVLLDRRESAEHICKFEHDDRPIETVLLELGERFVNVMIHPDHIALVRMVVGAADKFPEAGQAFYENGPLVGIRRFANYLRHHVEQGDLVIDGDVEMAAVHYFNLCQGELTKRALFSPGNKPTEADIRRTVASAVKFFLKAYGAK